MKSGEKYEKLEREQEELLKVLYSGEDYTLADKLLAELYEKWRPFAKDSGSPLTQKDLYADYLWRCFKRRRKGSPWRYWIIF